MTRHPRWVHRILSRDDLAAIVDAITRAESLTSAEVRVHLERRVKRAHAGGDPTLARARDIFARLEMHDTAHRASVLIYLAVEDRKLRSEEHTSELQSQSKHVCRLLLE